MAPTKKDGEKGEKEAKLTPEQSAALILDYLRKQNRPYSATDISTNLKNRVSKAAAAKLLKDMHERNEIEGRAAGKQIVYHVIQVSSDGSRSDRHTLTHFNRRKQTRTPSGSFKNWKLKRLDLETLPPGLRQRRRSSGSPFAKVQHKYHCRNSNAL